jgi:phosphinothricin acetyltransferase
VIVRAATRADVGAVTAIYAHHVLTGFGTFEEVPPSEAQIAERMAAVLAHRLPYLVAEDDGGLLGYAYASPFRPRAAYRYTAEDSVYIHPEMMGRGVGKALLAQVVADCEALGLRQLLAVIGDSGNAGSIALHRSMGFQDTGVGRAVGFKHGRWVDIVTMQRALNTGAAGPPDAPGLALGGG